MSARSLEKRGLLTAFAAFGAFWGAWVVVLPDVRERLAVGDGRLGLALGAIALAALPAMPLAGRLVDRHGGSRLVPVTMALFAVAAVAPAFAPDFGTLVVVLLLLGATTGAFDVVLNTATAAWERAEGERLMAAAHGCFSVGLLGASVSTGVARDLGAGPRGVLLVVGGVLVAVAVSQPAYRHTLEPAAGRTGRRRHGPVLVLLGLLTGASFLVEDAVQSWSALHLEGTLGAPPWVGGLGPGLFAGAMAAGRFGAHGLGGRVRDEVVVGTGASVLAAGVVLLALAPVAPLALVGAVVAGAGVSVLAPTLLSAVGARSAPGRSGADLALVSALGYLGFLLGPPLVGLLSSWTTLPTALALLAVPALALAVVGPLVLRDRTPVPVG